MRIRRLAQTAALVVLILLVGYAAGTLVGHVSQGAGLGLDPLTAAVGPAYSTWDRDADANYYRVQGKAVVGKQPEPGTVSYAGLDALGRATGATALVTYESMQAGLDRPRGDLSSVEPTGWGHNREVDIAMPNGTVYHGFLFNRSHLVAKSLGGDDEAHNLITGTRTQNVGANVKGSDGGMAYAEGLARSWLSAHPDGTVYYAATPVYEGDELVARSVLVDVRSSDGTLDQRIEVFNTARGFAIDYATGTFSMVEDAEAAAGEIRGGQAEDQSADALAAGEGTADVSSGVVPTGTPEAENGERKVIVTRSGKAYHHDETCRGLTNARSMEWVTVSEAESRGRHPCGICGG